MRDRIAGFDGLRAVAVGLVLINHKVGFGHAAHSGQYGVHLFFVLSGFLIVGILARQREAIEAGSETSWPALRRFFENRVYRIWPPYFLTIGVVLLMKSLGFWHIDGQQLLALATFSSNEFQAHVWNEYPRHIGPLWSVAIEEQFYLWAAPVFLLTPRRCLVPICGVVMGVAVVAGLLSFPLGMTYNAIYTGSLTNFGLMALGGAAAVGARRWPWLSALAPFALAVFLGASLFAWMTHAGRNPLTLWLVSLLAPVILLGIRQDQTGWLVRVLETWPLKKLGLISYGVYLYHSLILLPDWGVDLGGNHPYLAGGIEVVLSIAAAALSFRFLEQPLLRLRDRLRAAPRYRRQPFGERIEA